MTNREYKRPESVLITVYTSDGDVLLLRRREPSYFWQSVAGSLLWDEEPMQAACRELREETGLNPDKLKDCGIKSSYVIYPVWRHRYAPGVVENTEHLFRLELDARCGITLDPREHTEYIWTDKTHALELVVSHTNRTAIERWIA